MEKLVQSLGLKGDFGDQDHFVGSLQDLGQ